MKGGHSYHSAYIKAGDFVLAIGYNDEKYHAEVNAIRKLKKKYTKASLDKIIKKHGIIYLEVVRIDNKKVGFKNSKPCLACQKMINKCSLIKVVKHS